MKFIKIKVYEFNMGEANGTYDLYLNMYVVSAFYETTLDGNPCVNIKLLDDSVYCAPIEEFKRLKNNVISPFCGDV